MIAPGGAGAGLTGPGEAKLQQNVLRYVRYRIERPRAEAETGRYERWRTVRREYARCDMANFIGATGKSGDLFGETPIPRRGPATGRSLAPALTTARVLCRELRRKQSRPDKQRIAHLICLNLVSMLRHANKAATTDSCGILH